MSEAVWIVLCNCPDRQIAGRLAELAVKGRLAACVNRLSGVGSVYRWQGAIEQAEEFTLLFKTTAARYPELELFLVREHPHEVPEIIAWPIERGSSAYLDWVRRETDGGALA
ncbi:MAG: divalent-cation tolerance protein CutA [Pseudomonadota bacterium]|nr:divalent-cation tolerance protein CutA [Pseudomonadota bacterium]